MASEEQGIRIAVLNANEETNKKLTEDLTKAMQRIMNGGKILLLSPSPKLVVQIGNAALKEFNDSNTKNGLEIETDAVVVDPEENANKANIFKCLVNMS